MTEPHLRMSFRDGEEGWQGSFFLIPPLESHLHLASRGALSYHSLPIPKAVSVPSVCVPRWVEARPGGWQLWLC